MQFFLQYKGLDVSDVISDVTCQQNVVTCTEIMFSVLIYKMFPASDWLRRSAADVRDDLCHCSSYCNVCRAGRGGGGRLHN